MFKEIIELVGSTTSNAADLVKGLNGGIASADPGMRLISFVALILCILTIVLVLYKIIFLRRDSSIGVTTRWIFLITFIILSPLTYFISFGIGIEKSKPVEFCNNCHIMNSHVEDMKDPDSDSLASEHYNNRWIADDQCYTCHSDYGLYGAVGAKFDGIRHIMDYYILGYPKKLKIRGTYNNERCLFCHAPVESYQEVKEHQHYAAEIKSSQRSCFSLDCHVSPHPEETKVIEEIRRTK